MYGSSWMQTGKCKRCGCSGALRENGLCTRCDHVLYGYHPK